MAERAALVFFTRQAPGSQLWHDGYTVTGDAIIFLLLLMPSSQTGFFFLPPDIIAHLPLLKKHVCHIIFAALPGTKS